MIKDFEDEPIAPKPDAHITKKLSQTNIQDTTLQPIKRVKTTNELKIRSGI